MCGLGASLPGLHLYCGELLQRQHIGPGPEGGCAGGCAGAEAVLHQDQGVQRAQSLEGWEKEGAQAIRLFLQTMLGHVTTHACTYEL